LTTPHHIYLVGHKSGADRHHAASSLSARFGMSVAAKKGTILAAMAVAGPQAFHLEPFPLDGKALSERLGAVKGAPLLGAAKRTLAGEDRSGIIKKEGKAPAGTGRSGSQKVDPS
jgi:hypothetical protein